MDTTPRPKNVCILGSTGSIGIQALQVIDEYPELFRAEVLTANENTELFIRQALKYQPNTVAIGEERYYKEVSEALAGTDIKVFAGSESIRFVAGMGEVDIVLVAIVGFAGMRPAIEAIRAKKRVALANKESLVVAGHIISPLIVENRTELIPVDSEHSAIFQCLSGENPAGIKKLILTASGGPFRGKSLKELHNVTPAQALKHPRWDMGKKISIDSATMMNKGLEVIEAKWLFGVPEDDIEVIIHPESIIHSFVRFVDGSVKAQLSLPDMRYPIQYAFTYPDRLENKLQHIDFQQYNKLTFEKVDTRIFRNLALAYEAGKTGGNAPCILNAANEAAVKAFLNGKIKFTDISGVIEYCLNTLEYTGNPGIEELEECNKNTVETAENYIKNKLN